MLQFCSLGSKPLQKLQDPLLALTASHSFPLIHCVLSTLASLLFLGFFFFLPHLETCGSLGWEDLREKGKATHSYSGLENSMVSIVHGVAKSQTRLSNFHFHWGMWDLSSPTRDWNCALCPESLNHWSTREVCLAVPWMCQPHSGLGTFALVLCANWNTLPSDIHSQVTSAEVYSDHRLFCRHIWLPSSCSSFLFDVGFHFVIYKTVGLSSLFLIPTLSSRR